MTHHEYQEMLRAALRAVDQSIMQTRACVDLGHKGSAHLHLDNADKSITHALATPPPSNKLRDMKDAPRTKPSEKSRPVIGYPVGNEFPMVIWRDEDWGSWAHADGVIFDDQLRGWLPLPEVSE